MRRFHNTVVGAPAPDLNLTNAEGRMVSLLSFRGTPILVSFLSHAA
jgi:peroxiredoxin